MQKISPYNPVIIETARRFHESHNGELLEEMIHDVEENGEESPYHFIFNADNDLLEGSRRVKVGMGPNQVSYIEFLRYVVIAQAHLLREDEEISNLTFQIQINFTKEDVSNARAKILEIGESLGDSEINLYNFLIDLFEQIYILKNEAIKAKLLPDDAVRDYLSNFDIEFTLKHAGFGLSRSAADDILAIIAWASEGPANKVEIREPSEVVKND